MLYIYIKCSFIRKIYRKPSPYSSSPTASQQHPPLHQHSRVQDHSLNHLGQKPAGLADYSCKPPASRWPPGQPPSSATGTSEPLKHSQPTPSHLGWPDVLDGCSLEGVNLQHVHEKSGNGAVEVFGDVKHTSPDLLEEGRDMFIIERQSATEKGIEDNAAAPDVHLWASI